MGGVKASLGGAARALPKIGKMMASTVLMAAAVVCDKDVESGFGRGQVEALVRCVGLDG